MWGRERERLGQSVEKPRGYLGEFSPQGNPKAKTRGAAGPEGFDRGNFRGTPFHHDNPKAFPQIFIFWHPELE